MSIVNWLHHIFNPHCPHCKEDKQCMNCDLLRQLLAEERFEKNRLLAIIAPSPSTDIGRTEPAPAIPIKQPNFVPWRIRQQMLEADDRRKAQIVADKEKEIKETSLKIESIEDIEKELGIDNASNERKAV